MATRPSMRPELLVPTPDGRLPPPNDVVEIGEVVGAVRRRWRAIALATLVGALTAVGVLLFAPRRFEGNATVLVRSKEDAGGSLLTRLGLPADLAPSGLGSALKSPLETELQILSSRAVLGSVMDSLGLQVRVLSPRGVPPWSLLAPHAYGGSFKKRTLQFTRDGTGYRVVGDGVEAPVSASASARTPVGAVTLAAGPLPPTFEVQLLDREDALLRLGERVGVDKAGGEVVRVSYAASDSLSAAAVPNAIVATYLARRRTTDRGVNDYRAEFVAARADSVEGQLRDAERALRLYQERSGVVDPELVGKLDLEAAAKVREQLAANVVESGALEQMLRQVADSALGVRQLAAYPSFLRSPAINEILGQLAKLETERTTLRERRTDADPEVVALTRSIADLEGQLAPLGTAYASALRQQRTQLASDAARFEAVLGALPRAGEEFGRLGREVKRLGQASLVLQTQLLDARLAAIGEGGEVRQIDAAFAPKRVAFPRRGPTLAAGIGGGFALGLVAALAVAFFSPRVATAADASRWLGVPAAAGGHGTPVFLAALRRAERVDVVPLLPGVDGSAVVRWISPGAPAAIASRVPVGRAAVTHGELAGAANAANGANDRNGAGDWADGAERPDVLLLPPLSQPAGMAAVSSGVAVLLIVPVGATRESLVEAASALSAVGAELTAVAVV